MYIPDNKADDKILLKDRIQKLWDEEKKPLPPPKFEADDLFDRLRKEHEENQKKKGKEKNDTPRIE